MSFHFFDNCEIASASLPETPLSITAHSSTFPLYLLLLAVFAPTLTVVEAKVVSVGEPEATSAQSKYTFTTPEFHVTIML